MPTDNTSTTHRLTEFDVLRGVAVLGILLLNIHAYAGPAIWQQHPVSATHWTFIDQSVVWLSLTFGAEKFLTILSLLFGAGVALFAQRAPLYDSLTAQRKSSRQHYRRMAVLGALGTVHAYGLWFGDILVSYAICGVCLWWLRELPIRTQCGLAAVLLAVPPGMYVLVQQSIAYWPAEQVAEFAANWRVDAEALQREVLAYQGGWWDQWPVRRQQAWEAQTSVFVTYTLWRTLGLMLLGMAWVRSGYQVSQLVQTSEQRWAWVLAALVGILLCGFGAARQLWFVPEDLPTLFLLPLWNYAGSLLLASVYMVVIVRWAQCATHSSWRERWCRVGQMALSLYLLQTLIATTVFYGHGLGQFSLWPPIALFGMVLVMTVLSLWWAPWWLRHFPLGPAEWLWRRWAKR